MPLNYNEEFVKRRLVKSRFYCTFFAELKKMVFYIEVGYIEVPRYIHE